MTAAELIEELEDLIDRHGDCIVTLNGNDRTIEEVRTFDAEGMIDGKVVEFALFETGP